MNIKSKPNPETPPAHCLPLPRSKQSYNTPDTLSASDLNTATANDKTTVATATTTKRTNEIEKYPPGRLEKRRHGCEGGGGGGDGDGNGGGWGGDVGGRY